MIKLINRLNTELYNIETFGKINFIVGEDEYRKDKNKFFKFIKSIFPNESLELKINTNIDFIFKKINKSSKHIILLNETLSILHPSTMKKFCELLCKDDKQYFIITNNKELIIEVVKYSNNLNKELVYVYNFYREKNSKLSKQIIFLKIIYHIL